MSVIVIISLCVLLLIAYVIDISSKYTKLPSVILLMALGLILGAIVPGLGVQIPDLNPILPILGSVGLILIVLEGALELEVSKSKNGLIVKSLLMALIPMLVFAFALGWFFNLLTGEPFIKCIVNAMPLAVISSAIAIPSVKGLDAKNKEFVVYESSFSDILGVMFFNFFVVNKYVDMSSVLTFSWELILMFILAFVSTILLTILLNQIKHHVKFVPIILLVILIYEVSKIVHLPGLIFVLIFGLFLGNIDQIAHFKWLQKINFDRLKKEIHKFQELVVEFAFLIRTSFFILFGFLLKPSELFNPNTFVLSLQVFFVILLFRALVLLLLKLPVFPLIFIAPRGLITILLFLSVPAIQFMPIVNNSVIIQVIMLSAFWMMFGLMGYKKPKQEPYVHAHVNEETPEL